ncbi:hypothetical protein [Azospirillum sp. TSO35-2]|uniref:hypothetical protein n=1 Tax=Azospirillum sp. TSO35-2 TaxID=716796 RepID=UPI000D649527|nr:hypothetical protein [Azospirillum sp. TSO35-2]
MDRLLNRLSVPLPPAAGHALLAATLLTFAAAGPALAIEADGDGRIGNWAIGGLAYGMQAPVDSSLGVLNSKMRFGGSLVPQTEPYAAIRPWIGPGSSGSLTPRGAGLGMVGGGPAGDGLAAGGMPGGGVSTGLAGMMGGVLIDVPLGSFVFTPSFGAGALPGARREGAPTTEFRSQLELGYEFDNKSRFSMGYSRIVNDASSSDPAAGPNNVFGFYYRLPFGGP